MGMIMADHRWPTHPCGSVRCYQCPGIQLEASRRILRDIGGRLRFLYPRFAAQQQAAHLLPRMRGRMRQNPLQRRS